MYNHRFISSCLPYQGKMKWLYQWTSSYQVPRSPNLFDIPLLQSGSSRIHKCQPSSRANNKRLPVQLNQPSTHYLYNYTNHACITCPTIPTIHACLARTRTRATPPHIYISYIYGIFKTFQPPSTIFGTVVKEL